MGYYTYYNLEMHPAQTEDRENEIRRAIFSKIYECSPADVTETEVRFFLEDSLKWYNYDYDMKEISLAYPDITFVLSGEGEEVGDMWKAYYNNGESERINAELVYPEPTNVKFRNL